MLVAGKHKSLAMLIVPQGDYTEQKLINEETYQHIEALEDLAPLYEIKH